jgi:cytochrome bd ubiquinol oxidase subunit I
VDVTLLARIQFGLSLGFHFIFPATTLGLTLMVLVTLAAGCGGKRPGWDAISAFCVRLLAVVFTLGVATGITLPFAFGTNWARFSLFAGGVFGVQLAIEGIVAFTLEAAFLGILVFGRKRVGRGTYLLSAVMVFVGSHLSAFLIVSANSWMQTPAGYALQEGRVVLTDWAAAIFNPSAVIRFIHVIDAGWLTGASLLLGVSAWLARTERDPGPARRLFALSAVICLLTAVAQPVIGHRQIMGVLKSQPVKDAAYEGIFETQRGAPLIGFGIPDAANGRIIMPLGIPYGLSLLESGDPFSVVKGLNDYPREDWPPVNVIFSTFHVMVLMGILLIALSALACLVAWRGLWEKWRWYLSALPWLVLLPQLANETGWIGAEIGRQPWTVYGLLRTAESSSANVTGGQALFSLMAFGLAYAAITVLGIRLIPGIVRRGIADGAKEAGHE